MYIYIYLYMCVCVFSYTSSTHTCACMHCSGRLKKNRYIYIYIYGSFYFCSQEERLVIFLKFQGDVGAYDLGPLRGKSKCPPQP